MLDLVELLTHWTRADHRFRIDRTTIRKFGSSISVLVISGARASRGRDRAATRSDQGVAGC